MIYILRTSPAQASNRAHVSKETDFVEPSKGMLLQLLEPTWLRLYEYLLNLRLEWSHWLSRVLRGCRRLSL